MLIWFSFSWWNTSEKRVERCYFIGRQGLSKAVKSDFAKKKLKDVANKYLDQARDSFTSDLSKRIAPTGGGIDIHKAIGKLPRPKASYNPSKYRYK